MSKALTRYEALKAVRDAFVSQEDMADQLGVSQATVSRWLAQSKQLPAEYVLAAEALTGVSRHLLRPDIYPVDLPPAAPFRGVDQAFGRVSFQTGAVPKRRAAA